MIVLDETQNSTEPLNRSTMAHTSSTIGLSPSTHRHLALESEISHCFPDETPSCVARLRTSTPSPSHFTPLHHLGEAQLHYIKTDDMQSSARSNLHTTHQPMAICFVVG